MSDLIERLREAAAAGGATTALLTEAADWIVKLNGEHDALCTDRGTIIEKARSVVGEYRDRYATSGPPELEGPVAELEGMLPALPPEDVVPSPAPPVLVQTSAQVDVSQLQEPPGTRLVPAGPEASP